MPNGRGFVGTAAKGDGDANWWIAELDAFDVGGGSRRIASFDLQMSVRASRLTAAPSGSSAA